MRKTCLHLVALTACNYQPPATDPVDAPQVDDVAVPGDDSIETPRVTSGLIGFWRFDEGSGTQVTDSITPPPPQTPMNLTLGAIGFTWVEGGLQFDSRNSALSGSSPHVNKDVGGAAGTNAVTIEVWATSANTTQGAGSYSVVFGISASFAYRNAMIAQIGDKWSGRLSTTQTTSNGLPAIDPTTTVVGTPQHLVLVASDTDRVMYVNGEPFRSTPAGIGSLLGTRADGSETWDDKWRVVVGDEVGNTDRHWLGTLWLAAIYDRALSDAEIQTNFQLGPACTGC